MTRPAATVGIPVYNGERFLEQCLESVLSQTASDIEIIVSDNASTDRTPEICRRYAAMDSRIVALRSPENRGAAWNHNRVLAASRAPLFQWLGADDYLAPEHVERCAAALAANPAAVACVSATTVVDELGAAVAWPDVGMPLDALDPVARYASMLDSWPPNHNPFYSVFRASAIERAPRLGSYLGADRLFVAGVAALGPFVKLPEPMFFRRKHAGNRSIAVAKQHAVYTPGSQWQFDLRETRLMWEQLPLIARSPVPTRLKLRMLRASAARMASGRAMLRREWRSAAGDALRQLFHIRRAVYKETLQ